ncbi:MAG: ferritin-like domain-containing protein [Clostridia bacterium]|jgi:bacterioferritin|nr:ferritin-like domain-containing protein [Clostridiales bacterium]
MDRKKLISRLNWFFNLELNQVDLYTSQSRYSRDPYVKIAFERIAYIEQQHVDNIADKIKELGGRPSKTGDILAPILGSAVGTALSATGTANVLRINILIEKKAMKDYKKLIHQLRKTYGNIELVRLLQHNLFDEDLHTAWFQRELSRMKK